MVADRCIQRLPSSQSVCCSCNAISAPVLSCLYATRAAGDGRHSCFLRRFQMRFIGDFRALRNAPSRKGNSDSEHVLFGPAFGEYLAVHVTQMGESARRASSSGNGTAGDGPPCGPSDPFRCSSLMTKASPRGRVRCRICCDRQGDLRLLGEGRFTGSRWRT
jgi:hypothetical protein